jgi:predicted nucleic acid-binding protein
MQAVIDASYLIEAIRNIRLEQFLWVREGQLYAPVLLRYEYNNVVCRQKPNKEVEYAERELIHRLSIRYMDISDERLISFLFDKHKLSFYDASYLALAIDLGLPLATLDNQLIKAATKEDISLV